jgi:hypothetical protein
MILIVESKFNFLQAFNQVSNIKFHENPSSGIQTVEGGQTVTDNNPAQIRPNISQIQVHSVTAMLSNFLVIFHGDKNNIRTIQNILV